MGRIIDRRRVMGGKKGYIQWLKSLGCIVYLPLGYDGDLQDRISGLSLTLTGDGGMEWSSDYDMYLFTMPNNANKYIARLDNGMTGDTFQNDCYTTLTTFRRYDPVQYNSFGALGQANMMSNSENARLALNPMWNKSGRQDVYPNRIVCLGHYHGTDERIFYQDGSIYDTISPHTPYLPSSWVLSASGLHIGLPRNSEGAYLNNKFYMKELYIFNTKISLEVIRKIQGFD